MYDIQAVVTMNNIMGGLVNEIAFGNLKNNFYNFFWKGNDTKVKINHHCAVGEEEIWNLMQMLDGKGLLHGNYHLLHSNAYKEGENNDEATGHWNTYSYFIERKGEYPNKKSVAFGYLRFTVTLKKINKKWKIHKFVCDELMTFQPFDHISWEFQSNTRNWDLELAVPGEIDGENYILLRNLLGSFIQNGPGQAHTCFSKESFEKFFLPCVCFKKIESAKVLREWFLSVEEKEKNENLYHFLMTATSPVLKLKDECHAKGICLSQILTFEKDGQGNTFVKFHLGRMRLHFIREKDDGWKITMLDLETLFCASAKKFIVSNTRPMAMRNNEKWPQAPVLTNRLNSDDVQAIFEVESYLPQWTERLKRGDTETFIEHYMYNSRENVSFSMASGATHGYEKAREQQLESHRKFNTGTMVFRFPQFHTGNAPAAAISANKDYIDISWMEWGWGNIGYGIVFDEKETQRTYTPMIGQYYHKFVKDGEQWKLYAFGWKPLLQGLPAWNYDTEKVRGWSAKEYHYPWPLPFEAMKD